MENITGKISDPVRKIINIAQKTRQHCYTKLGKVTQKCNIQVPMAQRLEVSQIDSKKNFNFKDRREVGFLEPLF